MSHMPKRKYNSNEIVVNNKSSFKSHLVKCQAIMDNVNYDQLILRAMGKATFRATNLALQLNSNNYNTFELHPTTYSVKVLEDLHAKPMKGVDKDNFNPDEINVTDRKFSHVPAIEIVVRKSKLELDKIRQAINKSTDRDLRIS